MEGVRGVADQLADAERADVVEVGDEGAVALGGRDGGVQAHGAADAALLGVAPGLPDGREGAGEQGDGGGRGRLGELVEEAGEEDDAAVGAGVDVGEDVLAVGEGIFSVPPEPTEFQSA